MEKVNVLPTTNKLNAVADYLIKFTSVNTLEQGSFVEVTFNRDKFTNLASVNDCKVV